jgi:hypothetical protein
MAKRLKTVGGKVQPFVVIEAVGRCIDVSHGRRDDAMVIRIDPLDFVLVSFE